MHGQVCSIELGDQVTNINMLEIITCTDEAVDNTVRTIPRTVCNGTFQNCHLSAHFKILTFLVQEVMVGHLPNTRRGKTWENAFPQK